jgi:hypothetical protein
MSLATVSCPICAADLRSASELTAGKRVRCPKCSTPFVVPADAASQIQQAVSPRSSSSVAPAPQRLPANNRVLILSAVVGGLVLLTGASIGLALRFAGSKPAESNPSTPSAVTPEPPRLAEGAPSTELVIEPKREVPPAPAKKEDPPGLTFLPNQEQARVNKAVEAGIAYLKSRQLADGVWARARAVHHVGVNALPALTLLECGVAADDPLVKKAIAFVRKEAATNEKTYEIALAILLLDRVGDPQDRALIQSLGLRLIDGQTRGGGWTYICHVRNASHTKDLLLALERTRPLSSQDLYLTESNSPGSKGDDSGPSKTNRAAPTLKPEDFDKAMKGLPEALKLVPALIPPEKLRNVFVGDNSDNSNTQFGLLGVWVAGRHGVPTERALALVARRFRGTQTDKGIWLYHPSNKSVGSAAMTAAGLLGLAVGHGLTAGDTPKKVDDPAIIKALKSLSENIDKPLGQGRVTKKGVLRTDVNLYFLWSLERVGVLYNARTLDGKDWYQWGTELLVDHQNADGSWKLEGFPGSTPLLETSFALLFLKRANLVQDLSRKLEFVLDSTK